jgi:RNA polymerase sigma-70 factor (ECF subfamily)
MSNHDLESAFRELYEREFSYVYRSLRRLGVRLADLDDVTQEVFLRVYQRYPEATLDEKSTRPWLYSFAVRVAANYRRLARHSYEIFEEIPLQHADSKSQTPEQIAMTHDARDLVIAALASLSFDQRSVFIAYNIDQLSAPQISEALDIPLNTVYSRLRLARAAFQKSVQKIAKQQGRS